VVKEYDKNMKLHLGCGWQHISGYRNIDANPEVCPDVIGDMTDLSEYPDNSIEEILTVASFEHVRKQQVPAMLKEWYRVLMPQGRVVLQWVPDIDRACRSYVEGEMNLYQLSRYVYGMYIEGQGIYQLHKDLYSVEKIRILLESAGFVVDKIEQVIRPGMLDFGFAINAEAHK